MKRMILMAALMLSVAAAQAQAPTNAGSYDDRTKRIALDDARIFLMQMTALPQELNGERHFGIFIENSYRLCKMGACRVIVEPAEGEFGAWWKATTTIEMGMGSTRMRKIVLDWIGRDFSSMHYVSQDWSFGEDGTNSRAETIALEGGEWVLRRERAGIVQEGRRVNEGPVHSSGLSRMLLAEVAGRTRLDVKPLMVFRGGDKIESETRISMVAFDLWMRSGEPAEMNFRGAPVKLRSIEFSDRDGVFKTRVAVDSTGRILQMKLGDGVPAILVAFDPSEEIADIPLVSPERLKEIEAVLEAARRYLEVMAKRRPISEMDEFMDWASLRADLVAADSRVAAINAQAVGEMYKENFSRMNPLTVGQMEMLAEMLEPVISGDVAEVTMPGPGRRGFTLRRIEGSWRIVRLPN